MSDLLQKRLEQSLKRRLNVYGSPEYALTWKMVDMPAGAPICALRARARRISDRGCIGWPTPCTPSGGRTMSPDKMDATGKTLDGKKHSASLEHAVKFLIGWAAPRARDAKGNGMSIARCESGHAADTLDLQCKLISVNGTAQPSLLTARMDRGALPLNPRFSLWLQGFPATWADYAAPVTRLSRSSRRGS